MTVRQAKKFVNRRFSPFVLSTAVTSAGAEAVYGRATIPIREIQAGDLFRVEAGMVLSGLTGINTYQIQIRVGGLAGPVVFNSAAFDITASTHGLLTAILAVRTVAGAASTIVGYGQIIAFDAAGDVLEAECRGNRTIANGTVDLSGANIDVVLTSALSGNTLTFDFISITPISRYKALLGS